MKTPASQWIKLAEMDKRRTAQVSDAEPLEGKDLQAFIDGLALDAVELANMRKGKTDVQRARRENGQWFDPDKVDG